MCHLPLLVYAGGGKIKNNDMEKTKIAGLVCLIAALFITLCIVEGLQKEIKKRDSEIEELKKVIADKESEVTELIVACDSLNIQLGIDND